MSSLSSEASVTIGLRKVGSRDPEQIAFRSIKYETDVALLILNLSFLQEIKGTFNMPEQLL